MKKKLIIGIFFILYPFSTNGQVQIGIKGGYNYFWMIRSNTTDPHTQSDFYPRENAYSFGCFFTDQSKKTFNPSYELEYQFKSFRITSNYGGLAGGYHSNNNFELGFLKLYYKPRFIWGLKWKFIVNTGIYFNFLVHSHVSSIKSNWTYLVGARDTTYQGNAKKFIQSPTLGIMAGMGVQVPVSNKIQILIENNYSMGILSISRSDENGNLYNFLTTELTVGIAYRIETERSKTQKK